MEVECELLISTFKDPKTIALVKETIGHVSNGSSPHCAGALKLWLKKAFEVKKQKKLGSGVLLRCSRNGCPRNKYPISSRVAGSDIQCQLCKQQGHGEYLTQCNACGSYRSPYNVHRCGNWSCEKKFT